jgi:hypothetical protein
MNAAILFELPGMWICVVPLAVLLAFVVWRQLKRGLSLPQISLLTILRALPLLALTFLAARPVRQANRSLSPAERPVIVLVDRSASMALKEPDSSRYERALNFLNGRLLPTLGSSGLRVQTMLFAQDAQPAEGPEITSAKPDGKRTNLGGAIVQALSLSRQAPLAIVALTDGIANDGSDNARAVSALLDSRIPFIGVGFGSDQGAETLSLRRVDAPAEVAPRAAFSVSAELELVNAGQPVLLDLFLFRDGTLLQKRNVSCGNGSRTWLENFQLNAEPQGVHNYTVRLVPSNDRSLKCENTTGSASVRIAEQKSLRVLYIQGALTWDYKFISLALRGDPTIKLTGLTRTSEQSIFRQNVDKSGELIRGFPESLEEFALFRVVVLSNVRPEELSLARQEMLARFCSELGGGVLMIGGAETFDNSWQNSRLEQLLPVVLARNPDKGLDQPFRVQLTDEALREPLFELGGGRSVREEWSHLPEFSQYGRVDSCKLGARAWLVHPSDVGTGGRRILMASQRYGAGLSAVLCIQNFWRWRLAKDSDPEKFDRFWRQLFRWIGDAGKQGVSIQFAGQELRPQTDVRVLLERPPGPQGILETNRQFLVQVENRQKEVLRKEALELRPSQEVDFKFFAEKPDLYTVNVLDSAGTSVASRSIEIRDRDVELEQTARDVESLRQWASVIDGMAFKAEECPAAVDLMARIRGKVEQVRKMGETRTAMGLNWSVLSLVLGCLSVEWLLRKKWGLV